SEVVGEGDDWWRLWRDLRTRPSIADVILSVGRAALAQTFMNTRRPLRFSCLQQVIGSTKAVVNQIWPSLRDAHFHGSGHQNPAEHSNKSGKSRHKGPSVPSRATTGKRGETGDVPSGNLPDGVRASWILETAITKMRPD